MSELYEFARAELEDWRINKRIKRLSRLSGLDYNTVSYFAKGKKGLQVESLERLIDAMGYEILIRRKK